MSYVTNGRSRRHQPPRSASVLLALVVFLMIAVGWLAVLGALTLIGWLG